TALVRRGVEHVRIPRVECEIGYARLVRDLEDLLPRLTAVRGLVQAAVAAVVPQRALRRDVDDRGIAGVDDDLADVLRFLEADLVPALAAVQRLVDAVAITDASLAVVLARADPDGERIA